MSTSSATTSAPAAPKAAHRARRATAVAGGVVAGLIVWAALDPIGGVALSVRSGTNVQPVGWGSVVVAGLAAGLAGWALLAILVRRTARPRRVWTVTAVIVLALSLLGPLSAVDTASTLGLLALHITVGASLIVLLRRTA